MDVKNSQAPVTHTVKDVVDPQPLTVTTVLKMLNGTSEDDAAASTTGLVPNVRHTWECVTHFATPAMVQPQVTVALV